MTMAEFDRPTYAAGAGSAAVVDQGLRSYLLRVYNYMGLGLVVTGLVAYFANAAAVTTDTAQAVAQAPNGELLTQWGVLLYTSPLMWVVVFAPLVMVMVLSFGVQRMSASAAQLSFWAFAALMGLSLSSIFLVYTGTSIARVFFITAATFGAMSLYGYTTKRDLTGFGSFLFMGLIGIIIASIVNFFLASSALGFAISAIGVLIFVGLTAYDTQKIKEMYYVGDDGTVAGRKAIMGALTLYLDFVNLFLMLLRLFGDRR
jgi:FtsH-binding integral membrane protein